MKKTMKRRPTRAPFESYVAAIRLDINYELAALSDALKEENCEERKRAKERLFQLTNELKIYGLL